MTGPQRVQQRRTRGWRKPEGAVAVGRGTKWGNPFGITHVVPAEWWVMEEQYADATSAHEAAVDRYREYLPTVPGLNVAELAGKDLMCWCPLEDAEGNRVPCHADVLLEIANGGEG